MNLFALYERLEKIVREYLNPRTSSRYSAFEDLNGFIKFCLEFIVKVVHNEYHDEKNMRQLVAYFKEHSYIYPEVCDIFLRLYNNDDATIDELFPFAFRMFFETLISYCNSADPISKYSNYGKYLNFGKQLIEDLRDTDLEVKNFSTLIDMDY